MRASVRTLSLDFYRIARNLTFFALGTIFGYVIFESILYQIPPCIFVINTFLWLFIRGFVRRQSRFPYFSFEPSALEWRHSISGYIIVYALCQFAYWYLFWYGLTALLPTLIDGVPDHTTGSASSLALGVLSLTVVSTPLATRRYQKGYKQLPSIVILAAGILLLIAVMLIKLDLSRSDFLSLWNTTTTVSIRDHFLALAYPIFCLLGAVGFEAAADATLYKLALVIGNDVDRNVISRYETDYSRCIIRDERRDLVESATKYNLEKTTGNDLARLYIIISFPISIALAIAHAPVEFSTMPYKQLVSDFHSLWSAVWLVGWLAILGVVGSSAKAWFINPLQSQGLTSTALQPIYAARLCLFWFVAAAWVYIFKFIGQLAVRDGAPDVFRITRLHNGLPGRPIAIADLQILPAPHFTYIAGVGLAFFVAAVIWLYLWRSGLIKDTAGSLAHRLMVEAGRAAETGREWSTPSQEALIRFCQERPATLYPRVEHRSDRLYAIWRDNARSIELNFERPDKVNLKLEEGESVINGVGDILFVCRLIEATRCRSLIGW